MRMLSVLLIAMMLCQGAYAVQASSSSDDMSVDELRDKIVRVRRDMDKLMRAVLDNYPNYEGSSYGFNQDLKVDLTENDTSFIVRADLPGMDKDKIEITLSQEKLLKIAGERREAKKETAPGVVKQERMYGKFERVIELPGEALSEGISASYKDGVLEIVIPRKKPVAAKEVKIKVK